MKLFINYIYFPPEEIGKLIRNNSNNENWPRANKYVDTLKEWNQEFERQQEVVKRYVEHLKDRKKGDNNFVIQIKNTISQKIKILKDPDFLQQSYLDEETQKRELESLKKGKDIYEKYKRFSGSWINTTKEEGFDADKTIQDLRQWNSDRSFPIAEINKLLDDWQTDRNKYNDEFSEIEELKTFEIQLQERTKDTITFIWNVAKVDVPIYEEIGNKLEVKEYIQRRVFPNISNFLFFFNGQYYEVVDWEQKSINTVEVVAELSIFYNYYWYLIKCSANGIFHHSPLARSEICSCAEFDRATHYYDYVSDYELKLAIYKTEISMAGQIVCYDGISEDESTGQPTETHTTTTTKRIIKTLELEGDVTFPSNSGNWSGTFPKPPYIKEGQGEVEIQISVAGLVPISIKAAGKIKGEIWGTTTTVLFTEYIHDYKGRVKVVAPGEDSLAQAFANFGAGQMKGYGTAKFTIPGTIDSEITITGEGTVKIGEEDTSAFARSGKMVMPMIHGIGIKRVGRTINEIGDETRNVLKKKFWNDAWNALSGISIAGFSIGQGQNEFGVMYYLLNDKMSDNSRYHGCQEYKWKEVNYAKSTDGKGKYVKGKNGVEQMLSDWGLTDKTGRVNPFMRHFLQWHVKATLYWRKKEIWQGRYWLLHEGTMVDELCNASGNTITIISPDIVIARFTENINAKLGLSVSGAGLLNVASDISLRDDKGQNLRQAERTVVSDSKNSKGTETHTESKTITKSPVSMGRGNKPRVGIPSPQPFLSGSDHTKSEYTFLQFESRWLLSGYSPLGMRIQFNKDLLNQYRNRKELKGFPAYDYFNALNFGDILNNDGFLQASIISWNNVPYASWFREKIENGIYIYKDSHEEFYQKEISSPLSFASKGGTVRGQFNTFTSTTKLDESFGEDKLVHVDGLSWVWKDSFCQIDGRPETNVFPELMNKMSHNLDHENPVCWKFKGTAQGTSNVKLPTQAEGQWYKWWLIAYSREASEAQPKGIEFRCADEKGLEVIVTQDGAYWGLQIKGNVEYKKSYGDPEGIPPCGEPSADPTDPANKTPDVFNPQTPMPAESITDIDPVGTGLATEPELEIETEIEEEKEFEQEEEKEDEEEKEQEEEQEEEVPYEGERQDEQEEEY